MTSHKRTKIILFTIFSLWLIFLFSEPLFFNSKLGMVSYPFVKKGINLVCHQQENKLIEFFGYNSLVCTRCIGLYFGVMLGLLVSFFIKSDIRKNHKLFALALLLIFSDILLYDYINLYEYNKLIAFFTGAFLGSTVFNYFWNSLTQLKDQD